jgi:hypothetical protein
MAGPHSPHHGLSADGPPYTDPHPSQPIRSQTTYAGPAGGEPTPLSAAYPGQLPPPVPYPKRRRRRLVIGALVSLALIAALTAAIIYGAHESRPRAGTPFSDASAKTAIQDYLGALENRDTDKIARNMLCGIYDAVRDRRSDQALARLSSDAFRKQFSQAEVTSIDKIVYLSNYQAQVLFTMRVKPAAGGPARDQVQGLTQLLFQHGQILVCSYVLRTAGAY